MKDYIEERAIRIAIYIVESNATVRQTAKAFWGQQIYGTCGSNNIERIVWVIS